MVTKEGYSQREVALIYQVKPTLVRNLIRNEKLGKNTAS